jgi:mono/diheme cytochrome c family protein
MHFRFVITPFAALLFLAALPTDAGAQARTEPTRGELLYTTHCVECHNARVHWREKRLAADWTGLRAQVRRWQGIQKLGWSEQDITEVARYLNTFYYEYPAPAR